MVIFGFVFGLSQPHAVDHFPKYLIFYCFILLDIGTLLIWQGGSPASGLVFLGLSVLSVMLLSLHLKSFIYNFQIMIMGGIAIPSYLFYKKGNLALVETDEKISKIEEQQNLLDDRITKNREKLEAFSKKLDTYNKLKDLGEAFNAKLSLVDIYQLAIDKAWDVIGKTDTAKLFLADEDAQSLLLCSWKAAQVEPTFAFRKANIFDKWVFDKAQPLLISDITKDFRFDAKQNQHESGLNSLIIVPLVIQRRITGILRLSARGKDAYTADDLRLLDFISDLASAAINNARLYMQTQELAIRDSLTGLYVHRYFKERLSEEFNRCKKEEKALSIIMLDIDHFKDYNDKYGHAAGDKVLKGISDILRQDIPEKDIIARYGGEEFVALFPGEDREKAKTLAEYIRRDIESTPFILRRRETKITVSLGVASFPYDAFNEEELLKRMDFLLYKAKKEGRNKVCSS